MTLQLIILVSLIVVSATAAVWAIAGRRHSAATIDRITGGPAQPVSAVLLPEKGGGALGALGKVLVGMLPEWLVERQAADQNLAQAGFDSPLAPAWYASSQVVLAAAALALVLPVLGGGSLLVIVLGVLSALATGVIAPRAYVARRREARQLRIRRALPDGLDMMLVCVEAGISIDAAILRVGRELAIAHPELADELLLVSRRQNAGMSREDALRGLFERTGVDEVRHLVSSVVQAERWGTSMARTLTVTAETLRRQRKESAQRRAGLLSVKMVFPLALLILPPLMAVILGPAFMAIAEAFSAPR